MIDWIHWHNEPLLIGVFLLVAWAYALGTTPWRSYLGGGETFPTAEAGRFAGALIIFHLAVGSPLDQIGERYLLSAHMVQHMFIVYLTAPLALPRNVFFLTYEFAPRVTSLKPFEDQAPAGATMGAGGMVIGLGLIARSFKRWYQQCKNDPEAPGLGQLT